MLGETILSFPFKRNGFVSACPGALIFGNVKFCQGKISHVECESIVIAYPKLEEFFELLSSLGRNIVQEEQENATEPFCLENGLGETIEVHSSKICRMVGKKVDFELFFDEIYFMHLLRGIKKVVFFMLNPTKEEYESLREISRQDQEEEAESDEEKIQKTIQKTNISENEKYLLSHFLRLHMPIVQFAKKMEAMCPDKISQ